MSATKKSATTAPSAQTTILIVDDNPSNVSVIFETLRSQGFKTLIATDGELAFERACYAHPDLILLDIMLPGIDGFEVCRRLKANMHTADIPVIFMTALTAEEDKLRGFEVGGVDYITKPIHSLEVLARVTTHVRIHALTTQLQTQTDQLQMANHTLRTINTELKEFAYVVSHDLKAPLRGIAQLAHWITEDYTNLLDDRGKEMLTLMIGQVVHLDHLIDGILEYSRAGREIQTVEQVNLMQVVSEVITMLAPPPIHITIETALPDVAGDNIRLRQVFQNLLSNAIKFMDKPDGVIQIRSKDLGAYWEFRIIDNGPGIDAKYHDQIFRLFQTLRDTPDSTGIGLSVVKKIIELHQGTVRVESKVGEGSVFIFTLPKAS